MAIMIPPQMVNTMNEEDLYTDPIRRYMAPAYSERHPTWPSHPCAKRDSLGEAAMWVVEGMVHRYPTKVLAELVSTCPQYCGHCTRMDLVGDHTAQVAKYRFGAKQADRLRQMVEYLHQTPWVRDVVVSGGDIANCPMKVLESFVTALMDVPSVRDVRLATKSLIGMPQHFLQPDVLRGMERLSRAAKERGVSLAVHTHVNHAKQVTPLVARAVRYLLEFGFRDIRNQGVLLRGVNATPEDLLELCFALIDHAKITPYYFYMCDMIPNAEHWRVALWEAQSLQEAIMGYLPGFATPRIVCDVPYMGKAWVHQVKNYDRETGISWWRKRYHLAAEQRAPGLLDRDYTYYDPIYTLPSSGQQRWEEYVCSCE